MPNSREEETELAFAEDSPTVLAIDDDPSILQLVEACLSRADINTRTCDGTRAMRCYEATQPAVVLLDLRLGDGIFGSDIALELKKYENPPAIVLMSGQPELQRTAVRIGADGFLTKPFQLADLLCVVNGLLQKNRHAV